jgi:rubrerythrin
MPIFSTPFAGRTNDRTLRKEELIRAIRYSIAAEYEAVQLYMQLAESIDDRLAVEILKDIADEERVHAGEFLRLLTHLAPEEPELYAEGVEEVEEIMKKLDRKHGQQQTPKKNEDAEEDLPYCTAAPDPEHARGNQQDEPCDDARAGKVAED